MRRRDFIAGLGAAASPALWPRVALGQAVDRRRRVGVLMNYALAQAEAQAYMAAFIQRLRQLGWIEGHNVRIDVRWNGGDVDLARTDAAELIDLMPDAILAAEVTSAVPVVFVSGSDPGSPSFVASVKEQPGGDQSIAGKWLDLLKGVVTGLTRVAVMFNPDTAPQAQFFLQAVEAAAPSVGVATVAAPGRVSADIEASLATRLPPHPCHSLPAAERVLADRGPCRDETARQAQRNGLVMVTPFEFATVAHILGQKQL
jgi:putative tryptophan/tyrosine transport system substrate-binding protein